MNLPAETTTITYRQSVSGVKNLASFREFRTELIAGKYRCLVFNDRHDKILEFHFPLCFPGYREDQNLISYSGLLTPDPQPYIILLIRAGQSALACFDKGQMARHKVIRKYMVRKKQGQAQIKFQRRKTSASAGSRIRMANSISFFAEINLILREWFRANSVNKIIYSCTPFFWSMLFRSKISPPFEKHDPRLVKIPLHLPRATFKTLLYINHYVQEGRCTVFTDPAAEGINLENIFSENV